MIVLLLSLLRLPEPNSITKVSTGGDFGLRGGVSSWQEGLGKLEQTPGLLQFPGSGGSEGDLFGVYSPSLLLLCFVSVLQEEEAEAGLKIERQVLGGWRRE